MHTDAIAQESIDKVARYLIWAKPEYLGFLKSNIIIPREDIKRYVIMTNPKEYVDEGIYVALEKFFLDAGFSQKDTGGLQIGAGELIQNAAQHVYGLKEFSETGSINTIDITLEDNSYYVDIYTTTKYAPIDIDKVKKALITGKEISLLTYGRGFALMESFFDAGYIHHRGMNRLKSQGPYSQMGLIKMKNK